MAGGVTRSQLPTALGLLVATSGAGTALAVDAATFAVSAGFLIALRVPALVPPEAASFIRELRDGWREFRAHDWVWGIVLSASIACAAITTVTNLWALTLPGVRRMRAVAVAV